MKRILFSVMILALVAAAGIVGAGAYFSDTEQVLGNTISAGTIDISVDGTNPWTRTSSYDLSDLKPDVVKYIDFTVKNVGENPVVLWKKVKVTDQQTGVVSEPECTDQGGTWTNPDGGCAFSTAGDNNDLASVIHYDMTVGETEIIPEANGIMVKDVNDLWVPLGKVEPGVELLVHQSYRLDKDTGNWAQGDVMNFDITLYGEQKMGPGPAHTSRGLVLENKSLDPDWYPVMDGTWGILTWDTSGNYTMKAYGLDNSKTYRIAYWDGSSETGVSGYAAPSGGQLTLTGSYAGFTTNLDAKYWLRPNDWSSALTLWEANLVN